MVCLEVTGGAAGRIHFRGIPECLSVFRGPIERGWHIARDRHGIERMAQRYLALLEPGAPAAREKMAGWNSASQVAPQAWSCVPAEPQPAPP